MSQLENIRTLKLDHQEGLAPVSEKESTGYRVVSVNNEWDPVKDLDWGDNRDTLVERGRPYGLSQKIYDSVQHDSDVESSPERFHEMPTHVSPAPELGNGHTRRPSETPLLPPVHENAETPTVSSALPDEDDLGEFGSFGMTGVGTAARSSRVVPDVRHSVADESHHNISSPTFTSPVEEFASQNRPISVASRSSQRGRPSVTPTGPRRSSRAS